MPSTSGPTPGPRPDIVTRFAPSPTGHLHIGGARTALFCWAFAKAEAKRRGSRGSFMLRIEDTDQARSSDESARGICEDMAWLGILWDEGPALAGAGGDPRGVGPFFQAQRVELYNRAIDELVRAEKAYPAFETPAELEAKRRQALAQKKTYRYDRAALAIPLAERLARMASGEAHVVRFRMPDEPVAVQDQVLGTVTYAAGELDDFVIRKADGLPTYHFAVVVDDQAMGVTHVLRAQEHLNNTPRHVALQQALGYPTPLYAHMPLIVNMDASKMSKREKAKAARAAAQAAMKADAALTPDRLAAATGVAPATLGAFLAQENDSAEVAQAVAAHLKVPLPEIEVADFRRAGYLPEAITNFIALLGWSPGGDVEKFDRDFLAEHFDVARIGKTSAKFDRVKLLSFNIDYITALPAGEFRARFASWCAEFSPELTGLDDRGFALLCQAVQPRCKTFRDAAEQAGFLLSEDDQVPMDPAAVQKVLLRGEPRGADVLAELRAVIERVEPFEPAAVHAALESFSAARGLSLGKVAQPLRVALTGGTVSPPIDATMALLGKRRALARIDRCLAAPAPR